MTTVTLLPADLEMFSRFKVDQTMLERARLWRATDAQARNERGINGGGDNSGIVFDYFDPTATGTEPLQWRAVRLRRDHPAVVDGKIEGKYLWPAKKPRYLYIIPGQSELLKDVAVPVIFVEA